MWKRGVTPYWVYTATCRGCNGRVIAFRGRQGGGRGETNEAPAYLLGCQRPLARGLQLRSRHAPRAQLGCAPSCSWQPRPGDSWQESGRWSDSSCSATQTSIDSQSVQTIHIASAGFTPSTHKLSGCASGLAQRANIVGNPHDNHHTCRHTVHMPSELITNRDGQEMQMQQAHVTGGESTRRLAGHM